MNFKDFDIVTRCRAVLITSAAILDNDFFLYDDSFIDNLHNFYYNKMIESNWKRKDLSLIQYTVRMRNRKIAVDNQLTVSLLETILTDMDFAKNYVDLLDTLSPEQVDLVSNLSTEYVEYVRQVREAKRNIQRLKYIQ